MAYKDYLEVDIEKPVSTFVDLTNYFQARVGDAKAYCKLHIKSGSNSIDMTNKKMVFYGKDSNATPFAAAGGFDDDQPGDDRQLGLITFYFPEGIFQKEGKWQEAYFKIQGEDGSDISTVNLTLNVLPSQVEMGISVRPFIPELEKTRTQINQALREMNAQQLLNQIESMKTTVGAYTDLIEQHAVLNKPETVDLINGIVNPFRQQLTSQMNTLSSSITSQMNAVKADVTNQLEKAMIKTEWYRGTMLNGCTGWIDGRLIHISDIVIGYILGWAHFPEKSWKNINFATNPLASRVNFSNLPAGATVMLMPAGSTPRRAMKCAPDEGSNFQQIGLWNSNNDYNVEAYNDAADITFEFSFVVVSSQLK
jgi:hypothetical protein